LHRKPNTKIHHYRCADFLLDFDVLKVMLDAHPEFKKKLTFTLIRFLIIQEYQSIDSHLKVYKNLIAHRMV
jgi:hypothetical protein